MVDIEKTIDGANDDCCSLEKFNYSVLSEVIWDGQGHFTTLDGHRWRRINRIIQPFNWVYGWEDVVQSEQEVTVSVSTVFRCTGQLWTATCLPENHWPMTRSVSTSNICKHTYSCYYINTRINNIVYCTVFIVLCWSICVSARHAGV